MTKQKPTFIEHFEDITDPRPQGKQLHKLGALLFITLCPLFVLVIVGRSLKNLQG